MTKINITNPAIIELLDKLNDKERQKVADQIRESLDKIHKIRTETEKELTPEELVHALAIYDKDGNLVRKTAEDKPHEDEKKKNE